LYGAFVWARRALNSQKCRFPARAVVEAFLSDIWTKPCANGEFFNDAWNAHVWNAFRASPQRKAYTFIVSYLCFLGVFATMIFTLPHETGPFWTKWETVFWIFMLAQTAQELQEVAHHKGFQQYLEASGNRIDMFISGFALLALGLRVVHLIQGRFLFNQVAWIEPSTIVLEIAVFILSMLFIVCCFRLIHVFSIYKPLGVMYIIVVESICKDVKVFGIFCAIVIAAFTVGSMFFCWVSPDCTFDPTIFVYMVLPVTDNVEYDMASSDHLSTGWYPNSGWTTTGNAYWDSVMKLYTTVYYILMLIVMLNLLIAMLSSTYQDIMDDSLAEWRQVYTQIVKEYFEGPVLPLPLTLVESTINLAAECTCCRRQAKRVGSVVQNSSEPSLWGVHLAWNNRNAYNLHTATSIYLKSRGNNTAGENSVSTVVFEDWEGGWDGEEDDSLDRLDEEDLQDYIKFYKKTKTRAAEHGNDDVAEWSSSEVVQWLEGSDDVKRSLAPESLARVSQRMEAEAVDGATLLSYVRSSPYTRIRRDLKSDIGLTAGETTRVLRLINDLASAGWSPPAAAQSESPRARQRTYSSASRPDAAAFPLGDTTRDLFFR
jgi:hypothetical protein